MIALFPNSILNTFLSGRVGQFQGILDFAKQHLSLGRKKTIANIKKRVYQQFFGLLLRGGLPYVSGRFFHFYDFIPHLCSGFPTQSSVITEQLTDEQMRRSIGLTLRSRNSVELFIYLFIWHSITTTYDNKSGTTEKYES